MSNKPNISNIKFENEMFPTKADMELWNSLTPEEQTAYVDGRIEAGINSGIANPESAQEIINRVRSKNKVHAV